MWLLSSMRLVTAPRHHTGKMTIRLPAESKARHLRRRLVASAEEETRSRLPAAAGLASPLSMTKTAAREQWNDGMTVRLLPLAGKGASPRRLLNTRHSATDLAAEKESERTMPATGSTVSTDPWC